MTSAAADHTSGGYWQGSGALDFRKVFNLMQGFERAGIYTLFPAGSRFWEVLVLLRICVKMVGRGHLSDHLPASFPVVWRISPGSISPGSIFSEL